MNKHFGALVHIRKFLSENNAGIFADLLYKIPTLRHNVKHFTVLLVPADTAMYRLLDATGKTIADLSKSPDGIDIFENHVSMLPANTEWPMFISINHNKYGRNSDDISALKIKASIRVSSIKVLIIDSVIIYAGQLEKARQISHHRSIKERIHSLSSQRNGFGPSSQQGGFLPFSRRTENMEYGTFDVAGYKPKPNPNAYSDLKSDLPDIDTIGAEGVEALVEVGRKIGAGTFGTVYIGKRRSNGENVVIKVQNLIAHPISSSPVSNQNASGAAPEDVSDVVAMVANEVNAYREAEKQSCGNVVKLYEVIYDIKRNQIFYIMEFIKGKELRKIIEEIEFEKKDKPYFEQLKTIWPTEDDFIDQIVSPVVDGLTCLHNNHIAHRDIKPDNMMYVEDTHKAILIDLGLACLGDYCHDSVAGSPVYKGPEYFDQPDINPDIRASSSTKDAMIEDIWSLGSTLYEILVGHRVTENPILDTDYGYAASLPKDKLNELPSEWPKISKFVKDCLTIDPTTRNSNWESRDI